MRGFIAGLCDLSLIGVRATYRGMTKKAGEGSGDINKHSGYIFIFKILL